MLPTEAARSEPVAVLPAAGGPARIEHRLLPEEAAVEITYGGIPYAVMMMTPADLEDFGAGFSRTEGVTSEVGQVRATEVRAVDGGLQLRIELVSSALHGHLARRRAMAGRTSCGICGIETLAALPRAGLGGARQIPLEATAIRRALAALSGHQALNRATGAVHAAAFAGLDGTIVLVREDVGRHNALDKLIGAILRTAVEPASGFVVVTSRASFEMVEKVAAFGGHTLVAVSMPTALALDRARHHRIALIGVARHDSMTVFNGAERLTEELTSP